MNKIELKPGGAFCIKKNDQETIPGRFSMYVWDAFLTSENKESILDIEQLLTSGLTLKQCAQLLKFALNDYDRQTAKYNRADVMDLIDEVFEKGSTDPELLQLMAHGIGRIAYMPEPPIAIESTGDDDAEKKSE